MLNGYTQAGFVVGALRLATMATLNLGPLRKTKTCSPEGIFFPANPGSKNHLLQLCIPGDPAKCGLHKIMCKLRYNFFSKLTFENSLENKKCLIFQVII